jgi:O-antigen/teichoic acid export membrane protein
VSLTQTETNRIATELNAAKQGYPSLEGRGTLHLTSGRLLARNTIWNLLGQIVPMGVAVLAIPILLRNIGVPRFGVLSLAWILIGYFSLFDLGMGRALTKLVADRLGGKEAEIPSLVWTSLLLLVGLGGVGGAALMALSHWLVFRVLNIPVELRVEALDCFYLLALSLPLVTVTSGLRGVLEAQQRFRVLNAIRIPMSIFTFVGPLLVLPFSHRLSPIIAVLVVGRLVAGLVHLAACFYAMPALRRNWTLQSSQLLPVLRMGGWMTVSNVVSPLMMYLDRFLIGAVLTISAVAYYTVPYDFLSRLFVIPGAVVGVLFPAFAMTMAQDGGRAQLLLSRGVKYIFLAMFPILLAIITLAPEGLSLWLGPTFAANSSTALRLLAAGVFVNCMSLVPFSLVQGFGRPDITAKLHLVELPIYLVSLWLLVHFRGIEGAAMAWAGRVSLDAILLFGFAHWLLPHKPRFLAKLGAAVASALLLFYFATLVNGLPGKYALLGITAVVFGVVVWFWMLSGRERAFLVRPKTDSAPVHRVVEDTL